VQKVHHDEKKNKIKFLKKGNKFGYWNWSFPRKFGKMHGKLKIIYIEMIQKLLKHGTGHKIL
jgi:hypothetical protein